MIPTREFITRCYMRSLRVWQLGVELGDSIEELQDFPAIEGRSAKNAGTRPYSRRPFCLPQGHSPFSRLGDMLI